MTWWDTWQATLGRGWQAVVAKIAAMPEPTDAELATMEPEAAARLEQLRKLWDRAQGFDDATVLLAERGKATDAELREWWRIADELRANVLDALAVAGLEPEAALGVTITPDIIERAGKGREPPGITIGHPALLGLAVVALWYLGKRYFDAWDSETAHADAELSARLELNRVGKTLQESTAPSSVWPWVLGAAALAGAAWAITR